MKTAHRIQSRAKRLFRADPTAITRGLMRNSRELLDFDEFSSLALPVRFAYEDLRTGRGNADAVRTIHGFLNFCIATVVNSEHTEASEVACNNAMQALLGVIERYQRTGQWGLDYAAMRDIPPMIDFYEDVLKNVHKGHLLRNMEAADAKYRRSLSELEAMAA